MAAGGVQVKPEIGCEAALLHGSSYLFRKREQNGIPLFLLLPPDRET